MSLSAPQRQLLRHTAAMKKNPNRYITRRTGCLVERRVELRADGSLHEIITLSVPVQSSGTSA